MEKKFDSFSFNCLLENGKIDFTFCFVNKSCTPPLMMTMFCTTPPLVIAYGLARRRRRYKSIAPTPVLPCTHMLETIGIFLWEQMLSTIAVQRLRNCHWLFCSILVDWLNLISEWHRKTSAVWIALMRRIDGKHNSGNNGMEPRQWKPCAREGHVVGIGL